MRLSIPTYLSVSLLLVSLCLSIGSVVGGFVDLDMELYPNELKGQQQAFFTGETIWGNELAFIEANFTLSSPRGNVPLLELLVFHHSQLGKIGTTGNVFSPTKYCCTAELASSEDCVENFVILDSSIPRNSTADSDFHYFSFSPSEDGNEVSFRVEPHRDGTWVAYFANCDVNLEVDLTLSGEIIWKNSGGYLSATSYGSLLLYFAIGGCYAILLAVWLFFLIKYSSGLHFVVYFTSVLLVCSVALYILGGFMLVEYNKNGRSNLPIVAVVVITQAFTTTGIRLMLLLIALGFTIVNEVMSTLVWILVIAITLLYFVFAAITDYLASPITDSDIVSGLVAGISAFVLAMLNVAFVIWILIAFYKTVQRLKADKVSAKYLLYTRLSLVFILCAGIAIVVFIIDVGFVLSGEIYNQTGWSWLATGVWDIDYLILYCYVAWVFLPSSNNSKYAYQSLENFENDEEAVQISEGEVEMAPRQVPSEHASGSSDSSSSDSSSHGEQY
eukprot:TRINITY_DN1649_c0_g1_i1.p1 TRINITY_DN1649_c0_g1~~TRINITY_DN1649_c0_g1_i1.p1  ORF type:complete len:515 (-),score=85.61 TRINITY_DN1649_c0_g1_i1:76-1578(-)